MSTPASFPPRRRPCSRLFFSLACVEAAVMVPLSTWAYLNGAPPGLLGAGHGMEMLFGLAPMLIAGYLLGPQPPARRWGLTLLWGLGRWQRLFADAPFMLSGWDPLTGVLLTALLLPRLRHARKWRNRVGLGLVPWLCLTPLLVWWLPSPRPRLPAVLTLAALLTYMGGRIIAPLAAAAWQRQGKELHARVQPRLEGLLLVTFGLAWGSAWRNPVLTGLLLSALGTLVLARLWRWRLWSVPRPDLWLLGQGYGWLALGLSGMGLALINGHAITTPLHGITVGALGSLSCGVMARQAGPRHRGRVPPHRPVMVVMVLLNAATAARWGAEIAPSWLLPAASLCWSLAYLTLLLLLHGRARPLSMENYP
ncbi:NnrS family protein [Alcanivorax xiamenensis]|uniref:NnrS family protein n=1 Tax=Alcanivorax xiamenensis TaxID=1177156 RepID=A0ABQ6YA60_9GAMM|nr:NnrS family protein [Alcanivorax xiamenensis]KAF0806710.1 NnrS family protein [Alcanivorax xiamenensis]